MKLPGKTLLKIVNIRLNCLQRLMKLAVEQGKMSKIQEKERVEENAADAVADEIRADEEAEETKPIKKKKQNLKKGKKLDI